MSKFTDPRMEAHVEGFAEKPVHQFGASSLMARFEKLEAAFQDLLERFESLAAPKPAPEPPAPND